MYSAVKFKGRNLYYWARKGVEVPRKTRKVIIKSIDIKTMSLPEVIFCVSCSKGTYMRQLCADIGDKLDCGGYMAELRRTRSGCYDISQALTVEKLKSLGEAELSGILR
jgi:tRNA pseudouridine55 synthase